MAVKTKPRRQALISLPRFENKDLTTSFVRGSDARTRNKSSCDSNLPQEKPEAFSQGWHVMDALITKAQAQLENTWIRRT